MTEQIIDLMDPSMPGPRGPIGLPGAQGAPGLPGVNAVPADEAVAAYMRTTDSQTRETLMSILSAQQVVVAAHDSSATDKLRAHVVCPGSHDETVLQQVLDDTAAKSVTITLLDGTYNLDGFDGDAGVANRACLRIPDTGVKRTVTIRGMGWPCRLSTGSYRQVGTACLHVTNDALIDLGEDRGFVITALRAGQNPDQVHRDTYPSLFVNVENLGVDLHDNVHRVTCVDMLQTTGFNLSHVGVGIDKSVDSLVPESVAGCEGIRSATGQHYGVATTISSCIAFGFHTGFNIGGEHLLVQNSGALWCNYPWRIQDDYMGGGHPFTMINCMGECSLRGIRFGSHGASGTIIDYNMEVLRGDKYKDNPYRQIQMNEEVSPGTFHGYISYQISDGGTKNYDSNNMVPFWDSTASGTNCIVVSVNQAHRGNLIYKGCPAAEIGTSSHQPYDVRGWIPRYAIAYATNESLYTYPWVHGGVKMTQGQPRGFGTPMWFNGVTWITMDGYTGLIGRDILNIESATITDGFPVTANTLGRYAITAANGTYAYKAIHLKDGITLKPGTYKLCAHGLDNGSYMTLRSTTTNSELATLHSDDTNEEVFTINGAHNANLILNFSGTVTNGYQICGGVSLNPIHDWEQPTL